MPRKGTILTDEQKAARAAYQREYRRRHPERIKESDKRSREKNKGRVQARQKKWREANEEHIRAKGKRRYEEKKDHVADLYLRRTYGVSLSQYAERLAQQGGGCAICSTTVSKKGTKEVRFSIDHDRSCCPGDGSCGACVRALLCSHCNVGLGHFRDDTDLLEKAVAYLRHHREAANRREIEEPHQP